MNTTTIPGRLTLLSSGSWKARDNIAQFVAWARHLGLPEVVLFETSDVADVRQGILHLYTFNSPTQPVERPPTCARCSTA